MNKERVLGRKVKKINKIYAQMFSVREECEVNFEKTLHEIAQIGYSGVEFAGYYGMKAVELKSLADKLKLEVLSSHISLDLLTNNLDGEIATLKTLGAKYIVCPYASVETAAQAKELAAVLNIIGAKIHKAGLTLLYHNHTHELNLVNGEYLLEVLFDNVNSEFVKQQPDLYWIAYVGIDLIEYIRKNKVRIPAVHLKQMENMISKKNTDVGKGIIDFHKVMEIIPEAYFVYEQGYSDINIMDDMKKSFSFLANEK